MRNKLKSAVIKPKKESERYDNKYDKNKYIKTRSDMTCWKIPDGKTPKTKDNINFRLCLWIRDWWARENLYKREFIYCYK